MPGLGIPGVGTLSGEPIQEEGSVPPTVKPGQVAVLDEVESKRQDLAEKKREAQLTVADQFEQHRVPKEIDKRGFRLIDNRTPFERSAHADREWKERGALPTRYEYPKESTTFGRGAGFKNGKLNRIAHIEAKKQALHDVHVKWNEKEEREGAVGVTEGPPTVGGRGPKMLTREDELGHVEAASDKDWKESKKKHWKALQHEIWKYPNVVWRNRSVEHLRRALEHTPSQYTSRADNRKLLETFKDAGKDIFNDDDVYNSASAEMALFNIIRDIHPDWIPKDHGKAGEKGVGEAGLVGDYAEYMRLAPDHGAAFREALGDDVQMSNVALLRDALAILKFYDARASTRKRVGVVDTVASVSSLNLAASAHPNQIAVRR